MSADISRKTQYVDWSWKLEQLRNFNNELVNIYKMFKLSISILNIFMQFCISCVCITLIRI